MHELEEDLDLEGAGEVVECENEALRHNRPKHDNSQRKTYPKRNRHPIHEWRKYSLILKSYFGQKLLLFLLLF